MTDGEAFDLADERGRFTLVNFFATWCVPCVEEHDDLVRFANTHAIADDARVVSVVFSDRPGDVERFFESYLVAPDGRVVLKLLGGVRFDRLEELFAEASTR
jgi:cytochrome c biogenesis protein CcmG/thiol:disulfide interchange protein DsbE